MLTQRTILQSSGIASSCQRGLIYLDGNSLGPPLKATGPRIAQVAKCQPQLSL